MGGNQSKEEWGWVKEFCNKKVTIPEDLPKYFPETFTPSSSKKYQKWFKLQCMLADYLNSDRVSDAQRRLIQKWSEKHGELHRLWTGQNMPEALERKKRAEFKREHIKVCFFSPSSDPNYFQDIEELLFDFHYAQLSSDHLSRELREKHVRGLSRLQAYHTCQTTWVRDMTDEQARSLADRMIEQGYSMDYLQANTHLVKAYVRGVDDSLVDIVSLEMANYPSRPGEGEWTPPQGSVSYEAPPQGSQMQRAIEQDFRTTPPPTSDDIELQRALEASLDQPQPTTRPRASLPDEPIEGDETCVVCMEGTAEYIVADCGHAHLCQTCAGKVTACPTCRASKTITMRIFPV